MRSVRQLLHHGSSLRRTLLLVLVPAMLLVFALELWQTWRNAVDAANAAYDRSLYGAIKSIDSNLSTASGGLGVELPYRMLEFFELTANGEVYFRVATEDGLVEIGETELPRPAGPLMSGRPEFRDARHFGEPVRIGSYARELDHALAGQPGRQRVIIQVAESLAARSDFRRTLLLQAVARDILLLLSAIVLLVGGVAWALGPLGKLRDGVMARDPQDLTPVPRDDVPAEVLPLVDAINLHMERNRQQSQAMRRFIDDASHQLRTPLTTLATQVGYALREPDPAGQQQVLQAIKTQLDETVRQTNQMLSLGRADSAEVVLVPLDVLALAESTTRSCWSQARARGVDLGFDAAPAELLTRADAGLLREALGNLLHNALRYTPRGGQVTVSVARAGEQICLSVLDDGPGMPADELARAGERFFRGSNASQPGTGLGLAIVRAIVQRQHGQLLLQPGLAGRGLRASIILQAMEFGSPEQG